MGDGRLVFAVAIVLVEATADNQALRRVAVVAVAAASAAVAAAAHVVVAVAAAHVAVAAAAVAVVVVVVVVAVVVVVVADGLTAKRDGKMNALFCFQVGLFTNR